MNGADAAGQLVMNEMSRLRERIFIMTAVVSEAEAERTKQSLIAQAERDKTS